MDANTAILMAKGISEENAKKIAEVLDNGVPNKDSWKQERSCI